MTDAAPLAAGDAFGPYRLVRVLGEGGGGQVWEADDRRSGRRIALKVLTRLGADSREALERFEREGRLAASLSHPSCVYVFGAEEIEGRPTIGMELMRGGTLRDRLDQGPLPVEEAVRHVLDIVEGLEVAHRAGIVHRDVKPSNCFLDERGSRTKIGDWGVSRTLEVVSDLSVTGSFIGTPHYASPEQVRGEPLDFRSDLYSLGVTLYELLTGTVPYTGSGLAVAAKIISETPEPPSRHNAAVPAALDRVVMRLMAKEPSRRYPSYEALRKALVRFTPGVLTAPGLGRRAAAIAIDTLLYSVPVGLLMPDLTEDVATGVRLLWEAAGAFVALAYFSATEVRQARSLGKRLAGLRVATDSGERPSAGRLMARTSLYVGIPALPWLASVAAAAGPDGWGIGLGLLSVSGSLAIVATMRPRNGFAGLHEHLTGTRVVSEVRDSRIVVADRPPAAEPRPPGLPDRFGPYEVTGAFRVLPETAWLVGRDADLDRSVWLHAYTRPEGAPTIETLATPRPARLTWLQGARTGAWCWDAYGVPTGRSFAEWVDSDGRVEWSELRHVLYGLARGWAEGVWSVGEGPGPPTAEHLWVTATGAPRLLDVPLGAGAAGGAAAQAGAAREVDLVRGVARLGLEGAGARGRSAGAGPPRVPLPGAARDWMARLFSDPPADPRVLADELRPLLAAPAEVTPQRRAAAWGVGALVPLLFAVGVGYLAYDDFHADEEVLNPMIAAVVVPDSGGRAPERREAAATLLASLSARVEGDSALHRDVRARFRPRLEVRTADVALALMDSIARARGVPGEADADRARRVWYADDTPHYLMAVAVTAILWAMLGFVATLASFLTRGGPLLALAGIEVQTRDGARASALRCMARTALAWSATMPVLLVPPILTAGDRVLMVSAVVGVALTVLGAAHTLLRPRRALHDRLAGVYLVPR